MDSRERVARALSFEEPDRVPTDLWMSSGFKRKVFSALNTDLEALLDGHDIDLRYIDGPAYIGPPLDGTDRDIWGVRRQRVDIHLDGGTESYEEVAESPLAAMSTVEEIDAYEGWPSPDWFDYSVVEAQCEEIRRKGRVVVFQGDRMNRLAQLKPAMYLRGVEQIFVDMSIEPEISEAIFERVRSFYLSYADRIFEAASGKIDILLMGDDFGSQNGPLVSPEMWSRFLGNGFADYVALAKAHGIKVMHHSCGSVRPIIPLMVERGLDVLQSVQPEAFDMDPRTLKSEFGGRLAFHGGMSIQRTLPFGTPDDVRREVRDRIEALGPGGGYILCTAHNIQADTPVENALALLDAYREYGRY